MPHPAPFIAFEGEVKSEWLDYNGHMNVAFYTQSFDKALDALFEGLGIGEAYVREQEASCFAVEHHTRFLGELRQGERFSITCQLLGYDEKRIHCFAVMLGEGKSSPAATGEMMNLHVNMKTRRAAPFPVFVQERLAEMAQAHAGLPRPQDMGRAIMNLRSR